MRPGTTRAGPVHRLRPADLANLWAEGPHTLSQIALVGEFDAGPLRDASGRPDVERVRDELAARAWRVPELARRVHRTRRGEGLPVWVRDPAFDPAAHIGAAALPAGADLAAWCADRVVRPLDPDRPPWRIEVVDHLPDGRFGLLVVVHHVLVDGLAGVAVVGRLLDGSPDGGAPVGPAGDRSVAGRVPTHRELVADARRARRRALAAALRRVPRLPAALRRAVRRARDAAADLRPTAPRTSLPRRVGPGRRVAVVRFPLTELQVAGATVNDLLLAAVTAGLRDLFRARGEPVDGLTMRASVPVGVTGAGQTAAMLLLGLPVGEPDPRRRLARITATTADLKARLRDGGGDVFGVLHLPVPLARLAVRWMRGRAARHVNLFVTNVPGPPRPLWLAGARLLDAAGVAPLQADVPLGVAALSYAGTLAVTVNADAAVSDVDVLAAGIARGMAALRGPA